MFLKKLELMQYMFGKCETHKCKECSNYLRYRHHNRSVRKCCVYGNTRSEASDWTGQYEACGMFNKEWKGQPIIGTRIAEEKLPETPLDGQISFL